MKNKLTAILIITFLLTISGTTSLSAQVIKTTKKSVNIDIDKNGLDNEPWIEIKGKVTGYLYDVHSFVTIDGVDVEFHDECWEYPNPEEMGFSFYVPKVQDEQDHYIIKAKANFHMMGVWDVFLTPPFDDDIFIHIRLMFDPFTSEYGMSTIYQFSSFFY